MKKKYIVFTADVNPTTMAKLKNEIIKTIQEQYEEVYFLISSGGGNVFEGLSAAFLINAMPMKTIMHNVGQVDSVATAIFCAGKNRLSNKNASFLFHGVTMNLQQVGGLLEQQLKELYENSKRLKADIAKAISDYTSLPITDINDLMIDGGSILSAEESQTKGFITKIEEAQIPADADIVVINNI